MTQHTPGPWKIQRHPNGKERRLVVVGKSGMVADIDWNGERENDANARLIATAPELLAAVKDAAHDIKYVISQPWSKRSQGDTETLRHRLNCLLASIAKATEQLLDGKTPLI